MRRFLVTARSRSLRDPFRLFPWKFQTSKTPELGTNRMAGDRRFLDRPVFHEVTSDE
jgi:hypothetical protein